MVRQRLRLRRRELALAGDRKKLRGPAAIDRVRAGLLICHGRQPVGARLERLPEAALLERGLGIAPCQGRSAPVAGASHMRSADLPEKLPRLSRAAKRASWTASSVSWPSRNCTNA